MKREDIEKAANKFATRRTDFRKEVLKEVNRDDYSCRHLHCWQDFYGGAEWRINSVWHDNTTIPDRGLDKKLGVGKDVLLKPKYSKIYELCEVLWDFNENCIHLSNDRETFLINNIEIWAYLEDLLPNNKE